jgi:hypothetical protein
MKTTTTIFCALVITMLSSFSTNKANSTKLYPAIVQYIQTAEKDFDKIPADRKVELKKIAQYIQKQRKRLA